MNCFTTSQGPTDTVVSVCMQKLLEKLFTGIFYDMYIVPCMSLSLNNQLKNDVLLYSRNTWVKPSDVFQG